MKLEKLEALVQSHSGEFVCEQVNKREVTKIVPFKHLYDTPIASSVVPKVGKLQEFYATFSALLLYFDEKSKDAAIYIANPDQWESLRQNFSVWLESLSEDEKNDMLPKWIGSYHVIGQIPRSGNYILIPAKGKKAGYVFEFEHDGFEFIELAKDIEEYISKMLPPNEQDLTNIASHMRFMEDNPMIQWWIRELRDNKGVVVKTKI